MNSKLLTVCFLCLAMDSTAQSSFLFRNISINEGLSQSCVVDITADSAGFLWFATQDGLNRYDGKDFRVFKRNFDDITTHIGSRLGKIISGTNHKLWLISGKGKLEELDLYNNGFTSITKLSKDSLPVPPLSCLLQDRNGNLWLGSEQQGLIRYNPSTGNIQQYNTHTSPALPPGFDSINNLYQDRQGNIWVLSRTGILSMSDENSSGPSFRSHIASVGFPMVSFSAITEDADGNLWAGSYGRGLFLKKKNDSAFTAFKGTQTSFNLDDLIVEDVLADNSGNIWIGTYGKGLFVYNIKNASFLQLLNDKENMYSIGFNDILSIYQDNTGGIWLGTDGGGISYYNERLNQFTLLSNNNMPENISIAPVRSITVDKSGMIWAGTSSKGFSRIDLQHKHDSSFHIPPFIPKISNPERVVSLLTDEDNDIWIGTQGNGLLVFDNATHRYKRWFHPLASGALKIPDHSIWCMLYDKAGRVWAGTQNGGLCLIDKNKGLIKNFYAGADSTAGMYDNNIRAMVSINDSTLVLGYEEKGIQFFNTRKERFLDKGSNLSGQLKDLGITIKCLYYQHPILWIGTLGKGLIAYNTATESIHFITDEQGLPNNTVYGILSDEKQNLWLSSNGGICRFSAPLSLGSVNKSHFSIFTVADGLQSNEFNTGAYFKSADGILLFGGVNGLNLFNPAKINEKNQSVRVAITDISIDNNPLKDDTSITYKKILKLPYQYRSIAFRFVALDYVSANRYTYYYRMEGYDKKWIDAGNRSYTTYSHLPPGNYTFEVKAAIPGSNLENEVTRLSIFIPPPFWTTWWFLSLLVLLAALALYSLYRYRIGQFLRLQRVRDRIAADLHDDIGSTLSNINMLSAITQKKLDKPAEAALHLKRISEEVSSCGQALDDIIWSANSKNDTLEETIARMRRYAAELFEATGYTDCHLDMDEQFTIHKLHIEQRRDIYMIYKEALNNIYKHASAKTAWIKVKSRNGSLELFFRDNGKGFDTSQHTDRNGLKNIRARVEKWKGRLEVRSAIREGTTVQIELPLYRPNE